MLRPTGLGSGNAAQQLGAPYSLSREADRAGEASALPVRVSAAARHPSSLSFVPLGQLGCSDVPRLVACAARARPRRESLCYSVVAPTGDPGRYQSNDGASGPSARDNDTGGRR